MELWKSYVRNMWSVSIGEIFNEKGEITSISINLKQKETKIKRNLKSSNPIRDLFIGIKKGSIVVEETN